MKSIFSKLFFVALIFSGFAWISKESFIDNKERENERYSIQGAMAYWNMLHKNVQTGTVNPTDYYQALHDVQHMFGAQNRAKSTGLGLQWKSLGPDNIGGRTRSILIDKNNHQHMFAGGVGGGLWESNDAGQTWHRQAQCDSLGNMCITALAQAANGDIYFSTGEILGSNLVAYSTSGSFSGFPGYGVFKSTDDGATFTHLSSTTPPNNSYTSPWNFTDAIACSPTDPNTLYVATQKGLYVSIDAGNSFNPAPNNLLSRCTDVKISNDGMVIAAAFSGQSSINISTDGGNSFSPSSLTDGTNTINESRAKIVFAPSNNNYIYVTTINATAANVLRSTDQGNTWSIISPVNSAFFTSDLFNQGDYSMSLAVVPDNPDMIYTGGLDLQQYNGAGLGSWKQVSIWNDPVYSATYIHADHHVVLFDPTNPNIFFTGTDGGISVCANAKSGNPVFNTHNKGYGVTQLYGIGASLNGAWVGGAQDNGSFLNDYTNLYSGYVKTVDGGDGFEAAYSHIDTLASFVTTYGDEAGAQVLVRSINGGHNYSTFFDNHIDANADGSMDQGGFFMTRLYLYENEDSNLTALNYTLHSRFYLPTAGGIWVCVNPFAGSPTWYQITNAMNNALVMKCTHDGNTMFVGDESGNFWRIDSLNLNYPTTYPSATNFFQMPIAQQIHATQLYHANAPVTGIGIDPANSNNVVITWANYGVTNHILRITNAMTSTSNANTVSANGQGNLPSMPCYSIDINPLNNQQAVVATEFGVYSSSNIWAASPTWNDENATFPHMPTMQVFFSRCKQDSAILKHKYNYWLFAATHGRGAWYTNTLCVGCDTINTHKSTYYTGVGDQPLYGNVNIYPNPSTSIANIVLSSDFVNAEIEVYNLNGQMMLNEKGMNNKTEINIAAWNAGTYIVCIKANGKSVTRKFVKM